MRGNGRGVWPKVWRTERLQLLVIASIRGRCDYMCPTVRAGVGRKWSNKSL